MNDETIRVAIAAAVMLNVLIIAIGIVALLLQRARRRGGREGQGRTGLGLGLYISQELMRAQGGTIALASAVGEGTTASVRLPLLHAPGSRPRKARRDLIMFSAYGYPDYYVTALEQGAAGYLLKMATIGEVMGAVRTVAAGGRAFPSDVLRGARGARRRPTPRQREIIALVADGRTNEEIAAALSIHVKTVEGQLRRVFDRYNVTNRTELARVAEQEGWIGSP